MRMIFKCQDNATPGPAYGRTLNEALAAIGWSHEKGVWGHMVWDARGVMVLRHVRVQDVWDILRERGLLK